MTYKSAIIFDIGKRWENDIEHHSESVKLMNELKEVDEMNNNAAGDMTDIGGDGDLGETLMYLLDVVFEMRDRK